jgi:Zn-dependent M28 family amino/carboxypeptidase
MVRRTRLLQSLHSVRSTRIDAFYLRGHVAPSTRYYLSIGVLLAQGCAAPASGPAESPAPTPPAVTVTTTPEVRAFERSADRITSAEILKDITFLASDELLGRDTPSPGLETAAEYLASEFAAAGLEPAGDDGTYIQRYPYTSIVMIRDKREVSVTGADGRSVLEYGTDYYVLPGQQVATDVEVLWGGNAASPLPDVSAKAGGRLVLFYATENPLAGSGEGLMTAFQAAMGGGAAGIALALDQTQTADSIAGWASGLAGSGLALPVPLVGLSNESARTWVSLGGRDVDTLMEASSAVILEGMTATASAPISVSQVTPPNVVALRRGSDPALADEYLVYSAHFDHVGVGTPNAEGDSIFNGADDDASGTAVMLATARAFGRLEEAPARSVIFLAVSGEEKGLKGSEYFAQNPTVPLEGIIVNLNLDMVGRNHPDSVIAIGREYTNLGALSDQVVEENPEIGLVIGFDTQPEEQFFFRSDHLHFVKQDIPAIFFSTGEHDQYHKPSDQADLIDGEKAARVAKLVFLLGEKIATGNADPAWLPGGLEKVHQIIAETEGN